jgi:chromosome segregation ATPase
MRLPLLDSQNGISSSTLAILVAMAAILFVILHWRKKIVDRKNRPAPPTPAITGSPLSVREVTTEIEALLGELEETSRRLTAQLDNRYRRLEQLLEEADARIRRLEQLGIAAGQQPPAETRPQLQANAPAKTEAAPKTPAALQSALTDAQRTLARLREERGAPLPQHDPAYAPIYSLADRGKSPREIAQELGRQPGEIELILALRQRANK